MTTIICCRSPDMPFRGWFPCTYTVKKRCFLSACIKINEICFKSVIFVAITKVFVS